MKITSFAGSKVITQNETTNVCVIKLRYMGLVKRRAIPFCYIGIDLDPSKPKGMPLGLKLHTYSFTTKYINMAKA